MSEKKFNPFIEHLIIELKLYYQGGTHSAIYIPKTKQLITETAEMNEIINHTEEYLEKLSNMNEFEEEVDIPVICSQ